VCAVAARALYAARGAAAPVPLLAMLALWHAGAALLLGIGAAVRIARSVVGPLKHAVDLAGRVAEGDLTARIEIDGRDESADLLRTPTEALYTRSFTQPRAGLRSTWRGPEWAGTAFAIRDKGQGLVLLPGPYGTGVAEQPASDSVALRARSDTNCLPAAGD
jgi:HAMP domain-containing protein